MTVPRPPPSPSFILRPAVLSDLPFCVDIFHAAFSSDPNFIRMFPPAGHDSVALREHDIRAFEREFALFEFGRRGFVVVDEKDGTIAAFSKWYFPHSKTAEELKAEEAKEEAAKQAEKPIAGWNLAACMEFEQLMMDGRRKWLVDGEMYFLHLIAVRPEYQRKGLGATLLEPVLELADRDAKKTYLEASKSGVRLYKRYGWVEVGEMVLAEGIDFMIREPKAVGAEI